MEDASVSDYYQQLTLLNKTWPRQGNVWKQLGYEIREIGPMEYEAKHLPSGQSLGEHDHWSKARGACQQHLREESNG